MLHARHLPKGGPEISESFIVNGLSSQITNSYTADTDMVIHKFAIDGVKSDIS